MMKWYSYLAIVGTILILVWSAEKLWVLHGEPQKHVTETLFYDANGMCLVAISGAGSWSGDYTRKVVRYNDGTEEVGGNGCAETAQIKESVYDPNAPELKYLAELTDPNWIAENGVSKESRVLYNISVNRGMALKNQVILAEVAKRLIAMEATMIDPNEQPGPNEPYMELKE